MEIPTFSELRRMLAGARIGAILSVGPARWPGIRRFFFVVFVGVSLLLWLALTSFLA